MNDKCGKCGTRLPEDQVYPEYCCPTPSAAARAECGCGGWEQPWCQECQDIELARRMANKMTPEQRKELWRVREDLDEEAYPWSAYLTDECYASYAIRPYRAAKAYIETVDRLFQEVGK